MASADDESNQLPWSPLLRPAIRNRVPPSHLASNWDTILNGVYWIFYERPPGEDIGLSATDYLRTYTAMHDLLTNMKQIRGALVLYQAIEDIITSYVDAKISIVQSKQNDQDLIETYAREWQHFLCGSRFADHVLQFMNRHWIRREVDENKKGVFFIFHLCMKIWREAVFSSPEGVGERLSHSIVTLVRRDREGQTVDTSAIKTTLDSIQRLDLRIYGAGSVDVTPAQDFNAIVKSIDRFDLVSFGEPYGHKASLEIELIKDTESFYRDKANVAVSDMKVQDYIKSTELWIVSELGKPWCYIFKDTANPLRECCGRVLLLDQLDALVRKCLEDPSEGDTEEGVRERVQETYNRLVNIQG